MPLVREVGSRRGCGETVGAAFFKGLRSGPSESSKRNDGQPHSLEASAEQELEFVIFGTGADFWFTTPLLFYWDSKRKITVEDSSRTALIA